MLLFISTVFLQTIVYVNRKPPSVGSTIHVSTCPSDVSARVLQVTRSESYRIPPLHLVTDKPTNQSLPIEPTPTIPLDIIFL